MFSWSTLILEAIDGAIFFFDQKIDYKNMTRKGFQVMAISILVEAVR